MNDLDAAASTLRVYLIVAPTAADTASVNSRISQLEQQAVQDRQKAQDQRKLGELKKQQEQKQAEIDKQQQEEKEPRQQEQARQQSKADLEVECRKLGDARQAYAAALQKHEQCMSACTTACLSGSGDCPLSGYHANESEAEAICDDRRCNRAPKWYPDYWSEFSDPCRELYEQFGERL